MIFHVKMGMEVNRMSGSGRSIAADVAERYRDIVRLHNLFHLLSDQKLGREARNTRHGSLLYVPLARPVGGHLVGSD